MPGLVPGIHVFRAFKQDVDGRDKPGHDDREVRVNGKRASWRSGGVNPHAGFFNSFPTLPDRIASPSLPIARNSRTKSRTAERARISCG
jgi:hypothetical protein